MPQRTTTYTIVNANTLELFSLATNDQVLQTLTLTLIDGSTDANAAYGQIGILAGGITLQHKLSVLDQGPLDNDHDLFWTGSLHLPDDCHLFGRVISDSTRAFRLTALLWDFVYPTLKERARVT